MTPDELQALRARFNHETERIARAALAVGRDPASVRLLAVSKFQPIEAIRAAYAWGQRDFGENYVQELVGKAETLVDLPELRWHLIGHLQSNKAKTVVGLVESIQTVSSVKLARELGARVRERRAPDQGPLGVFIELDLAGEANKSGAPPELLTELLGAIEQEAGLALRGLMTIPPACENPQEARPYFERLAALRDAHGGIARLPELSMGMSHDAEQAILAGATWVRIGTALFGSRPATKA